MLGAPASAQGAVSGALTLVERRGADHDDLKHAVVWLEAPGRSVPADDPAHRSGTIAMRGREFIPHVRPILAGGAVAFPNQDPFSHNVFSNAEPGSFDLGLYRRGVSRAATFPRPGIYPIYCNIHSKMVSFVVAVPTPYVAQPARDGHFTIPAVPEGTYLLHAWHERAAASVTHEITVPASGLSGLRIALDAQSYVAAPHLNKFGLPYTATRSDRY
jgi:plastocyanin